MQKAFTQVKKHIPLWAFLALYLLFSLLFYKDIPIANGENFRYLRGEETLTHLTEGKFKEKLLQPVPHYFIYNGYTALQNLFNEPRFYEWFHLQNLLFASIIFVVTYFLAYKATKKSSFALFSLVALVLFPTFFGQLGFNPIDMPYAVFFMLGLFFIDFFAERKADKLEILVLGLVFGVAQSLRQLGFTLYVILFVYDLYSSLSGSKVTAKSIIEAIKSRLMSYILIFLVAGFIMMLTWPNFAINYFKGLSWHLFVGSNFYLWDYGLLFMGEFLENHERPAYYLPLLQIITSPVYISVFVLSSAAYFKKLIKNKIYFLVLVSFLINYALYFILKPVLYDGTRHFLFLVPLGILLAVFNLKEFIHSKKIKPLFKNLALGLIFAELALILLYTLRAFPYGYVYFNKLAYFFGEPNHVFESDYSSTKYKEAAEWLRDNVEEVQKDFPGQKYLQVYSCDNGFAVDYYSHKLFEMTIEREEADIILCDHKILLRNDYGGEVLHTIKLNSAPFIYVLKMR